MNQAYYARPMSIYGSLQEARDTDLMEKLGYKAIDINKEELQAAAKDKGMDVFKPIVISASALFFRSFPCGAIGAGVAKEIKWAKEAGIPVVELPSCIGRRTLTVEQTRETLSESGQR